VLLPVVPSAKDPASTDMVRSSLLLVLLGGSYGYFAPMLNFMVLL
jgi:hypothetical protein